jgi:hypothetical protein
MQRFSSSSPAAHLPHRLLSEHCESELQDLFDLSGTYVLDHDENSDSKILQVVSAPSP